ncbi:MAG: YjjG family noncanonical pyrimidine nucleotidase [Oscillospiraceae bacterium]
MSRYPYLLFDADNTLFDFSAAERLAFRGTCAQNGLPYSPENYEVYQRINAALWTDFDRGLCSKEFVVIERFRRFLAYLGVEGDAEACTRAHEAGLGQCAELIDGAEELCRTLSGNHKLYLITNAVAAVQRSRLAKSAIKDYLSGAFISEDAGCGKPQSAYFDYVFSRIPGITKENCLVIGDSLTSDIQGANNYGLPCVWYNPGGHPLPEGLRADHVISDLRELYAIIGD